MEWLQLWKNQRCEGCEDELFEEGLFCKACTRELQRFLFPLSSITEGVLLLSLYHYKGIVRDLIRRMKFLEGRYLSLFFAERIVQFLHDNEIEVEGVSFVPMHPRKRRQRGFDQARDLAEEVGKLLGLPMEEVLARTRRTPALYPLSSKERKRVMEKVFAATVHGDERLWLILDDISSSGATIVEAARALQRAGFVNFLFLTLAR